MSSNTVPCWRGKVLQVQEEEEGEEKAYRLLKQQRLAQLLMRCYAKWRGSRTDKETGDNKEEQKTHSR